MSAKPCLVCGVLTTNGSRCKIHQAQWDATHEQIRGSRHQRGYGTAWSRLSRAIIERDRGICYICGQSGANTVDHVVAKVKGGGDEPSNLAAAHRACNSAKGGR